MSLTNDNGEFSLKVNEGDVIVFTYSGYTSQSVKVGKQTNLFITMKSEATNLGEVVVGLWYPIS